MTTTGAVNLQGLDAAHKTVVSLGVIVLVILILVTIGGENHTAAVAVMCLFLSVVVIAGFNITPAQLKTVSSYPSAP